MVLSPYALHFSGDSAHKAVVLLGLERERPDGIVWGGAVFSNSFGQPSAYVFGGQRLYGWSRWDPLFAQWSAGLLYGYVGEYKNKVPLNVNGFSPGITPPFRDCAPSRAPAAIACHAFMMRERTA